MDISHHIRSKWQHFLVIVNLLRDHKEREGAEFFIFFADLIQSVTMFPMHLFFYCALKNNSKGPSVFALIIACTALNSFGAQVFHIHPMTGKTLENNGNMPSECTVLYIENAVSRE